MNPDAKWYALYTNPRAEKKVEAELQKHGFEAYLPLQETIRQWSDRKKKVLTPLFNSYIFVHISEKSYYDVLAVQGVVKFVKIGKELIPIPPEQIEAIRISLLHYSELEISSEQLEVSDRVEVTAGPLRGVKGFVSDINGNKRLAIAIEQIGSHLLVQVPLAYLKKIN